MITKNVWICVLFLALLLAGCAQKRQIEDGGNFTVALQCGKGTPLPLKVTGNVYADIRAFAASNCSFHGENRVMTVICPREELPVSPLVREAVDYLRRNSNQSES